MEFYLWQDIEEKVREKYSFIQTKIYMITYKARHGLFEIVFEGRNSISHHRGLKIEGVQYKFRGRSIVNILDGCTKKGVHH